MDTETYWGKVRWEKLIFILGMLGLPILWAGCAHHGDFETSRGEFTRVFTPQVPIFMNGPAAVLLTNTSGYSARATVQGDAAFPQQKPVAGELLCRGSKLLFAPGKIKTGEKDSPASGFIYVWDVATGSGQVRSEALQAYAPVSTELLRATNLVDASLGGALHEITVVMSDGSKTVFRTSLDSQKGGIPTRINATGNPALSVTLSSVRTQAPPADLFSVPEGFSKYPTAEALADELAARQHHLRRGGYVPPGSSSTPEMIRR